MVPEMVQPAISALRMSAATVVAASSSIAGGTCGAIP